MSQSPETRQPPEKLSPFTPGLTVGDWHDHERALKDAEEEPKRVEKERQR